MIRDPEDPSPEPQALVRSRTPPQAATCPMRERPRQADGLTEPDGKKAVGSAASGSRRRRARTGVTYHTGGLSHGQAGNFGFIDFGPASIPPPFLFPLLDL